jgi:DNA polymerase-4
MGGRMILHSDMNAFYASVEQMLDPSLRDRAIAVCGSQETRHGIVLAKSQQAKKAGVKTGMAIWQAKQCCPKLTVVPPQYYEYLKMSHLAHDVYRRCTDRIEPFGMDECWLDVTGCTRDSEALAQRIRETMKNELGLTVSIGVSFNKIFAKLGSDMKKPDAVTVISEENYKDKIWALPASDLLYCGPATTRKLASYGIYTIGEVAKTDPDFLKRLLGVNGLALWTFANGQDQSRVMADGYEAPIKSIGHGVTCISDLLDEEEVWKVILDLSQDVGHRLRANGFLAKGIQIFVRDNDLYGYEYQMKLEIATRSPMEIAEKAFALFRQRFEWKTKVRALCVRAISLVSDATPRQLMLFDDEEHRQKLDKLEGTVDELRRRFGKNIIYNASLMGDIKVREIGASEVIMPGMMYM